MTPPTRNLVLVSMDTLRADVAYSGRFSSIEFLRRTGTTYLDVLSSAPLTPVSHATIFTGLQPPEHGIRHLFRESLVPGVPTLAAILADAGYATGAFVSCPGMNRWYGLNRGFDVYQDAVPRLPDGSDPLQTVDVKERGRATRRAPHVVADALAWADALSDDRPVFLFVHLFDAHWPYESPEGYPGYEVGNAYEGEVAYADHWVGELFAHLPAPLRDPERTITSILSDHGEDLAGWYDDDHAHLDGYTQEEGHGCLLFDCTLRVPWVLAGPGIEAGAECHEQVRLVDVAPTLLSELGLPRPPMSGRPVHPLPAKHVHPPVAYSETFFPDEKAASALKWAHLSPLQSYRISGRTKMIRDVYTGGTEVYDLRADPGEHDPDALVPDDAAVSFE